MKKIIAILVFMPLYIMSQQIVIGSIDKNYSLNFATVTDTTTNTIFYTDFNGSISKKNIGENFRIDCLGFESKYISKIELTKDTLYLTKKTHYLNEIIIPKRNENEIGNIEGFKYKTNYNLHSMPLYMFIGIEVNIENDSYLKKIYFHSAKKSNKNQIVRARIFKKENDIYKEIVNGNQLSRAVSKGKNAIEINTPIERGIYYVCIEKVNSEIDYMISIGKASKINDCVTKSCIISIKDQNITVTKMHMKSDSTPVELMISLVLK